MNEEPAFSVMRDVRHLHAATESKAEAVPYETGDVVSYEDDADGNGTFEFTEILSAADADWADCEPGEDNGNGRFLIVDPQGRRYIAVTWYFTPEEA
jgi:hypothetical protein